MSAAPSYCCQKRLLFSRKLCLSQWRGSKWRVEGHENYAVSLFCLLLVPHDCKKNHHRPKFCHCVFLQCTKTRAVRLFHVLMRNGSKKTSFLFLLWSFPIVMAAAAAARLGYAYYACASLLVWAKCIYAARTMLSTTLDPRHYNPFPRSSPKMMSVFSSPYIVC